MHPKQILETFTPVLPRFTYSIVTPSNPTSLDDFRQLIAHSSQLIAAYLTRSSLIAESRPLIADR
jgi:hypothetical protein